jgi:hypothetical protein
MPVAGTMIKAHRGALLTLARKVWPRGWIRRLLPNAGLFMLIDARK